MISQEVKDVPIRVGYVRALKVGAYRCDVYHRRSTEVDTLSTYECREPRKAMLRYLNQLKGYRVVSVYEANGEIWAWLEELD